MGVITPGLRAPVSVTVGLGVGGQCAYVMTIMKILEPAILLKMRQACLHVSAVTESEGGWVAVSPEINTVMESQYLFMNLYLGKDDF